MNYPSNFYVDGKPWRIYLDGESWEPANTETERIANHVCDRYGVVDRVDFYRKVGSDYVLMEMESQEQAQFLAAWLARRERGERLTVKEFFAENVFLIVALGFYVLIVFSALLAAKIL